MKDALIKIGVSLIALIISAYVTVIIPGDIPFSAQSLVVFVFAGLLPLRYFGIMISLYLILGSLGLPVFAEGSAGWQKIIGPSGGFLYGFLFSGLVIRKFLSLGEVTFLRTLVAMSIGTAVLFLFGLGHLTYIFDFERSLEYGFFPFWKMALIKGIVAAIIVSLVSTWASKV